ncbi:MAG TPA: HAMP domain-containing sensor histidine kinase [Verrucomicrobiae bacterium]|nr:HAMP domain-containing sensor histidine kinase [Verrucomicrobiae bacterium]
MKIIDWERLKRLRWVLATDRPEPAHQAERIVAMQRDVVLPSKVGVILVVLYYLFFSDWLYETPTTRSVVQDTIKDYFQVYIFCNVLGALFLYFWRRLPPGLFQWLAFTMGLLDGLFVTGLTIVTGGFDSIVFWVFPCLIVINALSIPLAVPQIMLNLLLSVFYISAGLIIPHIGEGTAIGSVPARIPPGLHITNSVPPETVESIPRSHRTVRSYDIESESTPVEVSTEPFLLRVSVLWLLTLCCYGAQVLLERQRAALEEAGEFAARESQLRSAGRLAAEFAHQIKNPLAIINNTAFSLRRSMREDRADVTQQIEIIQEEVARADRVITQIMGYAQLSEGRVEKLDVIAELERAIAQVFPPAVPTRINIHRKFAAHFPPLLMQRGHLSEILVNLLQNARDVLGREGNVFVSADCRQDYSIEISVGDDGPGIPPDKIERIFEAYYTTKEKGTGLGLAIVKHNVELYAGTVRVESRSGQGATFVLFFPAKALMKMSKK